MDHGYALAQWNRALKTAATTQDHDVRSRAQQRMARWREVLHGLRSGELRIGSRTPVQGLPVWVTPEVLRGGFATGRPAAGGDLSAFERQLAHEAGLPAERGAIVEHALTADGMQRLWAVLDAGGYEIDLPEAAALLVVAWLVREGDVAQAMTIVDALRPHAHTVRLLPASATVPDRDPDIVWREDAATVAAALRRKKPSVRVARMNGVLQVWNPFADALLGHWLAVTTDGTLREPFSTAWLDDGRELLATYDDLVARHDPPARLTSPKENAAALRLALAAVTGGRDLTARERGRVLLAVASMAERRGAPGTPAHSTLRSRQHAQAALPTVAALAHLAADRLAEAPGDRGVDDVPALTVPVTVAEAAASGLPSGAPMPRTVGRVLRRAQAGTLHELVDAGVITSAELLATMVPQVTAQVVAEQYDDPRLRVLVARSYEAFRRRRSVLLLDLQQQVRAEELPWVAAVATRRRETAATRDVARATFLRLADEAVTHWPGALLPNPLVTELEALAASADPPVPLVQEIAADIFEGRFSRRYVAAFELAASSLRGSTYARYYGIDDDAVAAVRGADRPGEAFARLCSDRADLPGHGWCVVCHGMTLEQAQILTTHNLAALRDAGLEPRDGWRSTAERAFAHVAALVARLDGNRQPNRTLKDVAYAWRQTVFFVAQLDAVEQTRFVERARTEAHARSEFARVRLLVLLDGLARPGSMAPLRGWGHGRHWLLGAVAG